MTEHPSLYQINTRIWLNELARLHKRPCTFDDVPDAALDRIARYGFEWIWFLGVWQTGHASREVSARNPTWRNELEKSLPDLTDDDITGSPFAIQAYRVHKDFGGDEALSRLRDRLKQRGLKLMLDFVPNHTALDHPWVQEHPEFYVNGSEELLASQPQNYIRIESGEGSTVLAHGKDPYFDGWADTLQLNYHHPALQSVMEQELLEISHRCDGVRCDMSMLLLPSVFQQTWGALADPSDDASPTDQSFWPNAIRTVRESTPDFIFVAEVYWELESELQAVGFDFTYDKALYDTLARYDAREAFKTFQRDGNFQRKCVRFLENHDEPRANGEFELPQHKAAAVITYLAPGLRLFHEGQLKGRRTKVSMHLGRRPDESTDTELLSFYLRLLECLRRDELRRGDWLLIEPRPSWESNDSFKNFVCYSWRGQQNQRLLIAVNYSGERSQTRVVLPFPEWHGSQIILQDLMGPEWYERSGTEIINDGLFLELPPWGINVFQLEVA